MMKCDIILVRNYSFVGKKIRQMTNGYYNHVGIFIDNDTIIESSLFKGVKTIKFEKYKQLQEDKKLVFDIFKLKKSLSSIEQQTVIAYLLSKIGNKYDVMQFLSLLVFFLFNINRNTKPIDIEKAFICSELLGKAFNKVNISFKKDIDLDNLTPKDIENSSIIEKVI